MYLGPKKIGRVALQRHFTSAQVACTGAGHGRCNVWVTLSKVPDCRKFWVWLAQQQQYPSAEKHMEAFNEIVYGCALGPQGNGKPGG